jgi:hypothetical protein
VSASGGDELGAHGGTLRYCTSTKSANSSDEFVFVTEFEFIEAYASSLLSFLLFFRERFFFTLNRFAVATSLASILALMVSDRQSRNTVKFASSDMLL